MDLFSRQKEFRVLYETHYNDLCRASFNILLEKENAREIVQQVFLDLWDKQNWHRLNSVKAYLYVAVYNRSLNLIKTRKRFVSLDAMPETTAGHADLETEELRLTIISGIEALPDRCREIFLLKREGDMTYQEIADHLQLSIKTVERQMGIALEKLRNHLDAHWSG